MSDVKNELEVSFDAFEVEEGKFTMKITLEHSEAPDKKLEFMSLQSVKDVDTARTMFDILVESISKGEKVQ